MSDKMFRETYLKYLREDIKKLSTTELALLYKHVRKMLSKPKGGGDE